MSKHHPQQKPKSGPPNKKQKKSSTGIWWVAGIAVIAAGILVAISLGSGFRRETMPAASTFEGSGTTTGSATAKVKVVEFGDYL